MNVSIRKKLSTDWKRYNLYLNCSNVVPFPALNSGRFLSISGLCRQKNVNRVNMLSFYGKGKKVIF